MWFPLEVFLYSTPELLEPALQPRSRMVATTERDSSSNNCTLVVNASLKLLLLLRLLQHLNFIVVPPSRPLYPNGVVMALAEEHMEGPAAQYTDAHHEGGRGRGLLGTTSQGTAGGGVACNGVG